MEDFKKSVRIVVKAMDDVLEENIERLPLQKQKDKSREWRQIGVGSMGLADALMKLKITYGSDEAIEFIDKIGKELINEAMLETALLSKERGSFPKYNYNNLIKSDFYKENIRDEVKEVVKKYGMRNCALLSIAPNGSISTMIQTSGGIEPQFSLSYNRRTETMAEEEKVYKVYAKISQDYIDKFNDENLPPYFITSQEIYYGDRIKMQSTFQKYIDTAISSTINLPNEATVEDIENIYIMAWKYGLKGVTCFRDGCFRKAILTNKEEKVEETNELKRGEWEQKPLGVIEIPRKIYTGCGKELLHITISPKEKRIIDFYITSSSTGGCKMNIQALAISMSAILRLGGNVNNIKCAFRGLGGCPSYTTARAKGKKVSKGVSCPTAILNVLLEVQQQLENETLLELQELGYYDNKNNIEEEKVIEGAKFSFIPIDLNNRPKFTNEELKFIEEYGESAYSQRYGKCPICNDKIDHVGGCVQCNSCGWSKCS